ncbi:IS4 family transposase [Streptomyces sp. NPDC048291]|uniref:IS4 family transposase n=1 Tax=Streptomyces sp. NPDC048291 TaxID=3365530 RepID=UPI0037192ED9
MLQNTVPDSEVGISSYAADCRNGLLRPAHLGELTRQIPRELVERALEEEREARPPQRRRKLPLLVGVYFVLALQLFPGQGYQRVWQHLIGGMACLDRRQARVSKSALIELRGRVGEPVLYQLFRLLAGPVASTRTPGVAWRGWRLVAVDGCRSLETANTPANEGFFGRGRALTPWSHPHVQLLALIEVGTRAIIDAVLAAAYGDERKLAARLTPALRADMLVLADRGFGSAPLYRQIAATGAAFLVRCTARRVPPVLAVLDDGTFLSRLGGVDVRVIDADVVVRLADGTRTSTRYRLVTTLCDPVLYPAQDLIALYHERWEVESASRDFKLGLLRCLPLRSRKPRAVRQELWAALIVYQLLGREIAEAAHASGLDPDRISFEHALDHGRDSVIRAEIDPDTDYHGGSLRAYLLTPERRVPRRRLRTSDRKKHPHHRPAPSVRIDEITVELRRPVLVTPPPPRPWCIPAVPRLPLPPASADGVPPTLLERVLAALPYRQEEAAGPKEIRDAIGLSNVSHLTHLLKAWAANGWVVRLPRRTACFGPDP